MARFDPNSELDPGMDAPDCDHELCEFCWECHIVGCPNYIEPLKECVTHHVNNPRYSLKDLVMEEDFNGQE